MAPPLPPHADQFAWLEHLDGTRNIHQLHQHIRVPIEHLQRFVARLEHGLLLESPPLSANRQRIGSAATVASVATKAKPPALRRQLARLFAHDAGTPTPAQLDGSLRAALIPHIDYTRGGLSYTYPFKEVIEKSDASLFVIIGTSHYSGHRFTLTRKNFQTPLGIAQTDQDYIDRLVHHYGNGLFDDEWLAHFPEHSIELEVIFLQYLYEKVRPIRIVPLVVGSYYDCIRANESPRRRTDIANLIAALQHVEAEINEPICYLISGDLAHIGPKFDDTQRLDADMLRHSYAQDQALLHHASALDLDAYFRVIANERDARNICGLPPTFAALDAVKPRVGKVLNYDRYVHPQGYESVSFASMGFYR